MTGAWRDGVRHPTADEYERGVCALIPFVQRWDLSLNPEDLYVIAGAVLRHSTGHLPWEEVEADGASPGSVSFSVDELAVLADGRRVVLHEGERGWSSSGPATTDPLGGLTQEDIESGALTTVLPDGEDPAEEHPYEHLAALARAQGVSVTADRLRAVPYTVELGPLLQELLHR